MLTDRADGPLLCSECKTPVESETAWLDDKGKPIHAECYLIMLRREQATAPPLDPSAKRMRITKKK
jgi:hypothetical protein